MNIASFSAAAKSGLTHFLDQQKARSHCYCLHRNTVSTSWQDLFWYQQMARRHGCNHCLRVFHFIDELHEHQCTTSISAALPSRGSTHTRLSVWITLRLQRPVSSDLGRRPAPARSCMESTTLKPQAAPYRQPTNTWEGSLHN